MDYYGNNDWRDYLAHYGVKGMKWKNRKNAGSYLYERRNKGNRNVSLNQHNAMSSKEATRAANRRMMNGRTADDKVKASLITRKISRTQNSDKKGTKKGLKAATWVNRLLSKQFSSASQRPHSRKTTVSSGTATVKKGKRLTPSTHSNTSYSSKRKPSTHSTSTRRRVSAHSTTTRG